MQVHCKKCLLRELDDSSYYATIQDYLSTMQEDMKVLEPVYEARLSVCRECGHLSGGMCALCGCFVEIRAMRRDKDCPDNRYS